MSTTDHRQRLLEELVEFAFALEPFVVLYVAVFEDLCRVPAGNRIFRDVFHDARSGLDDRSLADGDSS